MGLPYVPILSYYGRGTIQSFELSHRSFDTGAGEHERERGIMAAPVLESDDSEPLKHEPPNEDRLGNATIKDALQRLGPVPPGLRLGTPSGRTTEALEPAPWKPRTAPRPRRDLFEGDAAAIELRARLPQMRGDGLPVERYFADPTPSTRTPRLPRFIAVVLAGAAVAGAVGYLAGGVRLSPKPRPAAATGDAPAVPVRLTAAAQFKASSPNPGLPPAQTAPTDAALGGARPAIDNRTTDTMAFGAAPRPGPAPSPAVELPLPDTSEIAVRLKLGAELMAAGDIAAARTMFARIAEAGDAAGAFALAETYDPAVLGTMRLRSRITPDPALAQRWYEKARDMGSGAAAARIANLTQNPQ
jgi:hypothetical protein